MAKASQVQAGDVVVVPVSQADFAVAKVLYVFSYWKDVILLGVSTEGTVKSAGMPSELPKAYELRIFTGAKFVGKKWPKVGHDPTPIDPEVTRRIVAGAIVVGDNEKVGVAGPDDHKRIPVQSISTDVGAVLKIQKALGLPSGK